MRYIPKKKLNFDYDCPEGPLSLIYQASDDFYGKINNWKLSVGTAIPATYLAYYTFGLTYWWAYPMMYLPAVFNLKDFFKLRLVVFRSEVYKMWLLQNGDQVII